MKSTNIFLKVAALTLVIFSASSCHDMLDEAPENRSFAGETDYRITNNMILPLIGTYAEFQSRGWEDFPLISVRGDDVNAGGLGDQQEFFETDKFNYGNVEYWMYNSVWQNLYQDVYTCHVAMEQIELYKEYAPNPAVADQYIAEAKTLRA